MNSYVVATATVQSVSFINIVDYGGRATLEGWIAARSLTIEFSAP